MNNLVLSLFPGIGLLDMAFEEEGFCVVRGPDLLWGGDIRNFHPPAGVFGGVIGGPPCQAFSRLRSLVLANGYELAPDLIPEFERCTLEAQPLWFLMENVTPAPEPSLLRHNYRVARYDLNNRWFGAAQNRQRAFWFGTVDYLRPSLDFGEDMAVFESTEWWPAVLAHGGQRVVPVARGGSGKLKASAAKNMGYQTKEYFRLACRLQGLAEDFDLPGFTVAGKIKALGNGVPLPMGRAIAKAIKKALEVR